MKNFIALSGLPRTGSTLLASILYQNPNIHTEGSSAVVQLMWDMQYSCENNSYRWLAGGNREGTQHDLVSEIPKIFYRNTRAENIFDKNLAWTQPNNVKMIKDYIREDPKIIVMMRPLEEIVKSFVRLRKENGWQGDLESDLWEEDCSVVAVPSYWAELAKDNNKGEFLFVEYEELVVDTQGVLNSIYEFCDIEPFKHDLTNIENKNIENDTYWGLKGMHEVRKTISKRIY
jgi:sulfotransferase